MTLILVPSLLIIVVSFFFSFRSAGSVKKNVVLGVTLPKEAQDDPRVGELLLGTRKPICSCSRWP